MNSGGDSVAQLKYRKPIGSVAVLPPMKMNKIEDERKNDMIQHLTALAFTHEPLETDRDRTKYERPSSIQTDISKSQMQTSVKEMSSDGAYDPKQQTSPNSNRGTFSF